MIYEYECAECAHQWQASQRMTDDPIRECTACGGKAKRLISGGAGFVLMGGGWYRDLYSKGKQSGTDDK